MPSQGVVDREGEEAELDGVVREQSRVLLAPHPETLLFPQLNLVKSWGSSQAHAQTLRANIMKWLVLQLLTLYCLGILPASGNWKERIDSLVEFPIYRSSSRNNKISNMMSTVEPLNRQ
nr:uncharacterized protein LOC111769911 isoform X2 [Equus caballus]